MIFGFSFCFSSGKYFQPPTYCDSSLGAAQFSAYCNGWLLETGEPTSFSFKLFGVAALDNKDQHIRRCSSSSNIKTVRKAGIAVLVRAVNIS